MTDLKLCPFCGGEAWVYLSDGFGDESFESIVQCDNGHTLVGSYKTKAEAIAAWNARADAEYGAVPATDENMAKYGWVREQTCRNIRNWSNHDFECSSCGYELYPEDGTYESDGTLRFCPNCGAKVVDA